MLSAVRIRICDDSDRSNGPLRVIPGSHLLGRLTTHEIAKISLGPEATCSVDAGGAILMRPLLVHASSASRSPSHRRVIHLGIHLAAAFRAGSAWYSPLTWVRPFSAVYGEQPKICLCPDSLLVLFPAGHQMRVDRRSLD